MSQKVVIIGAGFGGLATANLLARAGYEVAVYEKQAGPGGRAGSFTTDGFTFDTGPSWYLMPEVFEHYFALLDESIDDFIPLQRLDPAYRVIYEDASILDVHADLAIDAATFDALEPGAGKQLKRYLAEAEETYGLATRYFLYSNFDSLSGFLKLQIVSRAFGLLSALLQSIDTYVKRYFKSQKLQQIMEYPMVFLGTAPKHAPAMYRLMSHMDFSQGVFYPKGGMFRLIDALIKIGNKAGVVYYYNAPVEQILVHERKASGIRLLSGEEVPADIVISNADLQFTETQLLDERYQSYPERYWERKTAGPSALLLYLGIAGELPSLAHHNLLFCNAWDENFETIYDKKQWPTPASLYICKPTATDQRVAPKGYENLFVLVPGPARIEDSPRQLSRLSDKYLIQIENMTGISDLRKRIVTKKIYGPRDFKQDFNAWQGTALGLSHSLLQSAFFRPKNKSKKVAGLYFVGGNTLPGIGLPMCLISAELIYKRLVNDHSNGPLEAPIKKGSG